MTPDELTTRVHRQREDLIALDLAVDALMSVLPPETQTQWLQALRSLSATRLSALQASGVDPLSIRQGQAAIDRRCVRLEAQLAQRSTGA